FVGGLAGPLIALAAFFMLVSSITTQQNHSLYQSQANRNQNQQFNIQSFENGFFNMLEHHRLTQFEFVKNASEYARVRSSFQDEINKRWKLHNNPPIKLEDLGLETVQNCYKEKVIVNGGQHLIKSITILLTYIDSSININKEKYTDILFNRLALSEKRFLVGYALFGRMDLSDREYNLLVKFAKMIDREFHLQPHHFDWL